LIFKVFGHDLSGTADHRQIRRAFASLPKEAKTCGMKAITIEDLHFTTEKTRQKHNRKNLQQQRMQTKERVENRPRAR